MNRLMIRIVAACAIGLAGAAAQAQQFATTSKSVHLRAGPDRGYPVVAILAPGTPVQVFSCISGYTWCDVAVGADRGWVYAGNLVYPYENREVLLPSVAAVIGIGIAGFVLEDYWHDHYTNRWWWPQRRRWFRPAPLPPIRERQVQPGFQQRHDEPRPRPDISVHPQPQRPPGQLHAPGRSRPPGQQSRPPGQQRAPGQHQQRAPRPQPYSPN